VGLAPAALAQVAASLPEVPGDVVFRRRVEISVPTLSLAPQLVVGTGRVATITTRLAVTCAETLPLKLIPVPIAIPPMVEMLQWHEVHDHDPANRWFRRLLMEAVGDLPHEPPSIVQSGTRRESRPARHARSRRSRRRDPVAAV
jgi:hypothetical protein